MLTNYNVDSLLSTGDAERHSYHFYKDDKRFAFIDKIIHYTSSQDGAVHLSTHPCDSRCLEYMSE